MATVQQLLTMTNTLYGNAASDTDKILFMNMAQNELSPYFGIIIEDNSLTTTANQDSYALPVGLTDIAQIIALGVASQAIVTNRYDYVKYDLSNRDDYPIGSNSYFQTISNTGVKKIVLQPTPTVSGLSIRIRYRKALTDLSVTSLSFSPEFDSRFHSILAFYAVHMICASGASPDTIQADTYMQKYLNGVDELHRFQLAENYKSANKARDNSHWHNGKSFAGN